ncbi:copper ion binding protein [Proteinivorax hydrogeniformans]|uniref:Copper chaperone CopZ n=1 Tax=Proteinivorax hydrogeniformans TaxID=1826727 RepID=A0AAU8HPS6_9FIRM
MVKVIFSVSGMSCGHCKAAVEKALDKLDGVKTVDVNLELGEVTINYDENVVTREQLINTITDAGYSVI